MKKILLYIALILCCLQVMLSSVSAQTVKQSLLTKDSILIGDQIVWSTDFTLNKNSALQIFPYKDILSSDTTIKGGVEVVKDLVLDTLSLKDEISTLRAKVLLTSYDSGSYILPPPVILYSTPAGDIDTLKIDSKALYVNNLQIDTTSFSPYDIKKQEKYPFSFKQILPAILWIFFSLLALIIIVFLIVRYKKRKAQARFADPPHIVALKKLEKLRSEKLWQSGREKSYYSGITDTLKEYIDKSYKIGAIEMTSSEIMQALQKEKIDSEQLSNLSQMFSIADLVKFAKHTPQISDNEKSIQTAVNFVNYTYMKQIETAENNDNAVGNVDFSNNTQNENRAGVEERKLEDEILNYKEDK